jgi:hypothetical protein
MRRDFVFRMLVILCVVGFVSMAGAQEAKTQQAEASSKPSCQQKCPDACSVIGSKIFNVDAFIDNAPDGDPDICLHPTTDPDTPEEVIWQSPSGKYHFKIKNITHDPGCPDGPFTKTPPFPQTHRNEVHSGPIRRGAAPPIGQCYLYRSHFETSDGQSHDPHIFTAASAPQMKKHGGEKEKPKTH